MTLTIKELIEKLLSHNFDPNKEVKFGLAFAEDISDTKEIEYFDASYNDNGEFIIRVVRFL